MFKHSTRDIQTMAHGDDYVSAADAEDLKWMKGALEKRFKIKTKLIGPEESDDKELKVLNRIVRCTKNGYEYEADL